MVNKENILVQLTTVHPRYDTRIFTNECKSLAQKYDKNFFLVVADGKGDENIDGIQIKDLNKPLGGRVGRLLLGSYRAFRTIRSLKADVVHFHDSELMFVGILFSIFGIKVIYDVHEDISETIKTRKWLPKWLRQPAAFLMLMTEKIAALFFCAIVTVTPKIKNKFPAKKTILVQNFPRMSELEYETPLPYSQRENIVTYVGVLTRRRSALEMIEAFASIPASIKARLILTGVFRPIELEAEAGELPGWNSCEFKGWGGRAEVSERLAEARAGIVLCHPDPNHMEAKPVKMYEYMSAGLPVIASDFPTWREQISGVDCALFVNPQDEKSIAEAIIWILEHPEEAETMGKAGRKAVEELYNWDVESEKLLDLYDEITKLN